MKRRTFLTAAGTVGVVGVASSATVINSVYNNLSTSVLLEEFDTPSKIALDKFVADITENTESIGLNSKFAKQIAMPVRVISKSDNKEGKQILYKNKAGQSISISVVNGKGEVRVLNLA